MTALVRMRLAAFVRGGRALAPLIAVLVVLGVIYGGGSSPAAVAYGYSAAALFPVLAWQSKLVLDTEPDVQRRLARTAVGARREAAAGLLAAVLLALAVCAAAMLAPWLFGGIETEGALTGSALGVLAHLLAVVPAVAVGGLASRAVTGGVRNGVAVLVVAAVLVVVLGLQGSIAPWLVPPVMATARVLNDADPPPAATLLLITGWAALWCVAALGGYGWLRRSRA
ncbi:hypothetical protein [Actinoplanes sp. NPDC048796]|uniref:hypothetical protein n=1 Tax=unclassified Actinoplanes TaxID=2626549 RepID=UPI0033ED7189